MDNYDVMCISLESNMTDNEIKECIQLMIPACIARTRGFCLTISGFDDDPRELWQIPEATEFMRRLVDLGFISALEVSTTAIELLPIYAKGKQLPGFGALEVWMCGTGRMSLGSMDVTRPVIEDFHKALQAANRKAQTVCDEPSYVSEKRPYMSNVPDGQARYRGFRR
jgi:hypothetical protein